MKLKSVVKRFERNWPLAYLVVVFAAAGALFLISLEAGRFLGDVFYGRYDGRAFYYPALYLPTLSGIILVPAAFLVLLVVWLALRLSQHRAAGTVAMRYALIVLFMASILAVAWLSFDFVGSRAAPYARHVSSEQVGDTTYHLTAIATLNRDVYAPSTWRNIAPFKTRSRPCSATSAWSWTRERCGWRWMGRRCMRVDRPPAAERSNSV
jgi:hypothetical protein